MCHPHKLKNVYLTAVLNTATGYRSGQVDNSQQGVGKIYRYTSFWCKITRRVLPVGSTDSLEGGAE